MPLFAFHWNFFFFFFRTRKANIFSYNNYEHPFFSFRRGRKWWCVTLFKPEQNQGQLQNLLLHHDRITSVRNTEYTEILFLNIFRKINQYIKKSPLKWLLGVKSDLVQSFLASLNRGPSPRFAEHFETPLTAVQMDSHSPFPRLQQFSFLAKNHWYIFSCYLFISPWILTSELQEVAVPARKENPK